MDGTPYTTDGSGNVQDDRSDPFYCPNNASNSDTSKRCVGTYAHPDSFSWSRQTVTQIQALGTDRSDYTSVATTHYYYSLTAIPQSADPVNCNPITGTGVPAAEANCVGNNWSPYLDGDWADYYHSEFRGYNGVYIVDAASNLTSDYYYTTEGWGTP